MTPRGGAARRYAEAYFDVATAASAVPQWGDQLREAVRLLSHEGVMTRLSHPRWSLGERVRYADSVLVGIQQPTRNLVRLLIERRRSDCVGDVLACYDACVARASGVVQVEVTTAVPVDEQMETDIVRTLSGYCGGEVDASMKHDPAIIGGMVVRIGDRVIDSSVRTQLQQLRTALV